TKTRCATRISIRTLRDLLLTTPSAPLRNGTFLLRRSHPSLKTEGNELFGCCVLFRARKTVVMVKTRYRSANFGPASGTFRGSAQSCLVRRGIGALGQLPSSKRNRYICRTKENEFHHQHRPR